MEELTRFLEHPELELSNNLVERSMRKRIKGGSGEQSCAEAADVSHRLSSKPSFGSAFFWERGPGADKGDTALVPGAGVGKPTLV